MRKNVICTIGQVSAFHCFYTYLEKLHGEVVPEVVLKVEWSFKVYMGHFRANKIMNKHL